MKNLLKVVKANKKEIITKGIIVLGTIGGMFITEAILNKDKTTECDDYPLFDEDTETTEVIDISTDTIE